MNDKQEEGSRVLCRRICILDLDPVEADGERYRWCADDNIVNWHISSLWDTQSWEMEMNRCPSRRVR